MSAGQKNKNIEILGNFLPLAEFLNPPVPFVPIEDKQKRHIEEFNRQVLSGKITFEEVPCLCSSTKFYLIANYDRYSMLQSTVICAKCGLIQSNPRMTREEYIHFYRTDTYRNCYESGDFLQEFRRKYQNGPGKDICETIIKFKSLEKVKSVLELGAGGGWNLLPFLDAGISVTGYDYSTGLVGLGRDHGLNMVQGGVDELTGKFDVIILNHVVEHFTDLIGSMTKICEHLIDDGLIYISVPNILNFSMNQIQNAHAYYFTLDTLRFYLSHCGLRLVHFELWEYSHLSAVFKKGSDRLNEDILRRNFRITRRAIRRHYYRRKFIGLLDSLGLKDELKSLFTFNLSK